MDASKQKRIAYLVGGGAVLFFVGLVFWFLMIGGGAAAAAKQGDPSMMLLSGLPLGITVIGLFMAFAGLVIGWKSAFSDDSKRPLTDVENIYIIAAFILDRKGDKVFEPEMYEPDDIRHYVQIRFPDGTAQEVQTAPELFALIGEGMKGTATIQGRWMSAFVPNRPPS